MPAALTTAAFSLPARATAPRVAAPVTDTPTLGGLSRLVGLVSQGLAAAWVPFCPDLMNEVARGTGRRD